VKLEARALGITAGSREVPGRNACDRRHTYDNDNNNNNTFNGDHDAILPTLQKLPAQSPTI